MPEDIKAAQFREYINRIDDDELQEFIDEIHDELIELEQDDFFGTEGFEKRFA